MTESDTAAIITESFDLLELIRDEREDDPSLFEESPFAPGSNGSGPPAALEPEEAERGSFEDRFRSRQVDLFHVLEHGIPPIEYLPASEGMYVRGKRHSKSAPRKTGKSLGELVHVVDMILAGARVAILDRENGARESARRLGQIMASRGLNDEERATVRAGLTYYEFPKIRAYDQEELAAELAGVDLVIYDSQRRFLTDLGLAEDSSDDYATFAAATIDVLFERGIASVLLDNTGHQEKKRARGTSAKGDLPEVLMTLETIEPYSTSRVGKIRLHLEPGDSRFGDEGAWDMKIGAGVFGPWERVNVEDEAAARASNTRDEYTEWFIAYLRDHPEGAPKVETVKACKAAHEGASRDLLDSIWESLLSGSDPRASRGPGKAANSKSLYPASQASFPLPDTQTGSTGTSSLRHPDEESFRASHSLEGWEAGSTSEADPPEAGLERLRDRHLDIAEGIT